VPIPEALASSFYHFRPACRPPHRFRPQCRSSHYTRPTRRSPHVIWLSADPLITSGPCATHFTTPGPRAAQPTSPSPSTNLTTTSTDLDHCARFPPSSSTSHHRRTPTSPTPSDTEINPSAFLAQLYPSVSGCNHDVAQADDVDLGPAPKDVVDVKDSRPPFWTVNGQPPGKRNRKLTRAEKDKWKIEEARRRGEQTYRNNTMPFKRVWPRTMADHIKFAVLFSQRRTNRRHFSRSTRLLLFQLDCPSYRISSWFYVTDIN